MFTHHRVNTYLKNLISWRTSDIKTIFQWKRSTKGGRAEKGGKNKLLDLNRIGEN